MMAFDLGDWLRFQRHPIKPAIGSRNVAYPKTKTGKPLARAGDDFANATSRRRIAGRRHQLKRHVIEGEQYSL